MPTPVGKHKLNPRNLVVACHLVDLFFLFLLKHQESLSAFIQPHCCIKILLSRLLARNAPCHDQYKPLRSRRPRFCLLFLPFPGMCMKDWKLRKPVEELLLRPNTRLFISFFPFPSLPSPCIHRSPPLPFSNLFRRGSRHGLVPLYRSYSSSGHGSGRHTSSDSSSSSQEHPVHEMSLFLSFFGPHSPLYIVLVQLRLVRKVHLNFRLSI